MKIDSKLQDVLKRFAVYGFNVVKRAEHIKLKNSTGATVSLPNHKRVKGSTLSKILGTVNINKNEFFKGI